MLSKRAYSDGVPSTNTSPRLASACSPASQLIAAEMRLAERSVKTVSASFGLRWSWVHLNAAPSRLPSGVKTEPALVFADKDDARAWRVEWFDEDGGCEVTVFYGPRPEERARAFAKSFYGEVQDLEIAARRKRPQSQRR